MKGPNDADLAMEKSSRTFTVPIMGRGIKADRNHVRHINRIRIYTGVRPECDRWKYHVVF